MPPHTQFNNSHSNPITARFINKCLLEYSCFFWASSTFRREITMIIFKIQAWIIESLLLSPCFYCPFHIILGRQCLRRGSAQPACPLWPACPLDRRPFCSSALGLQGTEGCVGALLTGYPSLTCQRWWGRKGATDGQSLPGLGHWWPPAKPLNPHCLTDWMGWIRARIINLCYLDRMQVD